MECERCGDDHGPFWCFEDEAPNVDYSRTACMCKRCVTELEIEDTRPFGEETHA